MVTRYLKGFPSKGWAFYMSFLCLLSFESLGQERVSVSVTDVSLFENYAFIQSSSDAIKIREGVSILEIQGVSKNLDISTLSINLGPEIQILGISHESIEYPTEDDDVIKSIDLKLQELKDSLKSVDFALQRNEYLWSVLHDNRVIEVSDKSIYVDDLDELLFFFKSKTRRLESEKERSVYHRNMLNGQIDSLKTAKQQRVATLGYPKALIRAQISSQIETETTVQIGYKSNSAGWDASYTIIESEYGGQLNLNANIFQQSGQDWNNVNLNLSYGNGESANAPRTNFELADKIDLNSGELLRLFNIQNNQLDLNTFFVIEPSKSSKSLEQYHVKGLSGEFYKKGALTFISKNNDQFFDSLESSFLNDSLSYFYGFSNQVNFKRDLEKEKITKALIGNKQSIEIEWKLTVSNQTQFKQLLKIKDLLPEKGGDLIGFELNLPKNATTSTNEFSFIEELKAGETKSFTYGFKLSAPKGVNLNEYYEN